MKRLAEHLAGTPAPAAEDWAALMQSFCDAAVTDKDKAETLAALQARPVTGGMLAACAQYLMDHAVPLRLEAQALDVCGTGGDKSREAVKTFNISTAAAFVLAAGGARVVKHGNRAVSSRAGSSDVLAALGVPAAETEAAAREAFRRHGLCFVAAPAFHPALKSLAPARRMLGAPTFINLLGPLCNPARVARQVMGVYRHEFLEPVAEAARLMGKTDMMILHSEDGLDEISIAAPTYICHLKNGKVTETVLAPEEAGLARASLAALAGGEAAENAGIIRRIFTRPEGPGADIVCLNAAAGFMVAGAAESFHDGFALARQALESGKALQKLRDAAGAA